MINTEFTTNISKLVESNEKYAEDFVLLEKYFTKSVLKKTFTSLESRIELYKKRYSDFNKLSPEEIIKKYNLRPTENSGEYFGEEGLFQEIYEFSSLFLEVVMRCIENAYHKMSPADRIISTKIYNNVVESLAEFKSEKTKVFGKIRFAGSSIETEFYFKNRDESVCD